MMRFLILTALFLAGPAWALDEPVRDLRDYPDPARESVVRVRTARVLTADYGLLRRDFPQLAAKSESEIDAWLLEHAGSMSLNQVRNPQAHELNTPIDADFDSISSAWRPEGYGRGLVFDASDGSSRKGLLDGKGFGALAPRKGLNGSGLLPLAEALRELVWERTIAAIFEAEGGKFTTTRCYAVIDWGFDLKHEDGSLQEPAGAVLRQAHTREHWNFNSNLPKDVALEIELLLRRYGITSAGLSESLRRQGQVPYDLINEQGRRLPGGGAMVVDFGTYVRVADGHRFEKPIAARANVFFSPAVVDNDVGANREVGVLTGLLSPGQESFVDRPERTAEVPAALFGLADPARLYPETDKVSTGAAEWIAAYRKAMAAGASFESARAGLERRLNAMLAAVRLKKGSPELKSCERRLTAR